jgi:NADH-quinone oxidoreductase subunit A
LQWAMVFGILLFAAITVSMKEYRNAKSSWFF